MDWKYPKLPASYVVGLRISQITRLYVVRNIYRPEYVVRKLEGVENEFRITTETVLKVEQTN